MKHSLSTKPASQPTTISWSQLGCLTSPGPCRLLHMHLQGIRILRVRDDDESRQHGRDLAGFNVGKRLGGGGAFDTNGSRWGPSLVTPCPQGGRREGSWKASRGAMLRYLLGWSKQGSSTQAPVYCVLDFKRSCRASCPQLGTQAVRIKVCVSQRLSADYSTFWILEDTQPTTAAMATSIFGPCSTYKEYHTDARKT